jgi:hypothetical protein
MTQWRPLLYGQHHQTSTPILQRDLATGMAGFSCPASSLSPSALFTQFHPFHIPYKVEYNTQTPPTCTISHPYLKTVSCTAILGATRCILWPAVSARGSGTRTSLFGSHVNPDREANHKGLFNTRSQYVKCRPVQYHPRDLQDLTSPIVGTANKDRVRPPRTFILHAYLHPRICSGTSRTQRRRCRTPPVLPPALPRSPGTASMPPVLPSAARARPPPPRAA